MKLNVTLVSAFVLITAAGCSTSHSYDLGVKTGTITCVYSVDVEPEALAECRVKVA